MTANHNHHHNNSLEAVIAALKDARQPPSQADMDALLLVIKTAAKACLKIATAQQRAAPPAQLLQASRKAAATVMNAVEAAKTAASVAARTADPQLQRRARDTVMAAAEFTLATANAMCTHASELAYGCDAPAQPELAALVAEAATHTAALTRSLAQPGPAPCAASNHILAAARLHGMGPDQHASHRPSWAFELA